MHSLPAVKYGDWILSQYNQTKNFDADSISFGNTQIKGDIFFY